MLCITLKIDGMACQMCEAHLNDTLRSRFPGISVKSSHRSGTATILSPQPLPHADLKAAVEGLGYTLCSATAEQTRKRGLFARR